MTFTHGFHVAFFTAVLKSVAFDSLHTKNTGPAIVSTLRYGCVVHALEQIIALRYNE